MSIAQAEIPSNARGIPRAPFVDKVENFLEDGNAELLIRKFNETLFTYKRMEATIQGRRKNLSYKIPELEKSLEAVKLLLANKESVSSENPLICKYELADSLYANAKIEQVKNVGVWLGANVMLEFPVKEASELLEDKLKTARESFKVVQEDLLFLKEQITTIEVNIARVYNWDVKRRKTIAK